MKLTFKDEQSPWVDWFAWRPVKVFVKKCNTELDDTLEIKHYCGFFCKNPEYVWLETVQRRRVYFGFLWFSVEYRSKPIPSQDTDEKN